MNRTALALLLITVICSGHVSAQDRMPVIPADKLTDAQRKAVADYKAIRGADLAGPPWSVILRVPDLVVPSLQMRMHNINNSALSPRLTEFAILIAARYMTSQYEWSIHAPDAQKAGLSPVIIRAVAEGRRPETMSEDEEILYDFCMELLQNHSVSDHTYARALARFGEAGVVEATALEGYYIYIAMLMNMARSPLNPGQTPGLAAFPKTN